MCVKIEATSTVKPKFKPPPPSEGCTAPQRRGRRQAEDSEPYGLDSGVQDVQKELACRNNDHPGLEP